MNPTMVIEYIRIPHEEDCPVGVTGFSTSMSVHPVTGAPNPPSYKRGDLAEIEKIETRFCCATMADAFWLNTCGFGSLPAKTDWNKVAEVLVYTQKNMPDLVIHYCPFCGSPIHNIDITDKFGMIRQRIE